MKVTNIRYIAALRGMPWLERGMSVEVDGRKGVVSAGNEMGNIQVLFEGERYAQNCHPRWKTVYYDKAGNVLADYRDQVKLREVTVTDAILDVRYQDSATFTESFVPVPHPQMTKIIKAYFDNLPKDEQMQLIAELQQIVDLS